MRQNTFYQIVLAIYSVVIVTISILLAVGLPAIFNIRNDIVWMLLTFIFFTSILYATRRLFEKFLSFCIRNFWKHEPFDWKAFMDEVEEK
jgi:hypothetical protein